MAGTAYIEATHSGSGVAEFTYRNVDRGRLTGAALTAQPQTTYFGQVHCIVGIMRGGKGEEFAVATLIDDYVSDNHHPGYDGDFYFITGDILFLKLTTDLTYTVRLAITLDQDAEEGA